MNLSHFWTYYQPPFQGGSGIFLSSSFILIFSFVTLNCVCVSVCVGVGVGWGWVCAYVSAGALGDQKRVLSDSLKLE